MVTYEAHAVTYEAHACVAAQRACAGIEDVLYLSLSYICIYVYTG